MARVPQIAGKADVPESHQYVVDQVLKVFGRVRGPFSILLHSPELAERLLPMVPFAREGMIVEPQLRQVALPQGHCYFCERYFDAPTCPVRK